MPDSAPLRLNADRNLLFGILALQMDFISRDALIAGMHAWVLDKARSLGRILVEQGALKETAYALLDPLLQAHLEEHGGDAQKSLAANETVRGEAYRPSRISTPAAMASRARTAPLPENIEAGHQD